MRYVMYPATSGRRFDVQRLLRERASWLRERGSSQWDGDLVSHARVASIVAQGWTWLTMREDDNRIAGTITLSPQGDPGFWTREELAEPAMYVSKMATSLAWGRGLGGPMLRWAADQAHQAGIPWLRLDVYRLDDAAPLRAWYQRQGAELVRVAEVPGKRSGALFRLPAGPDPEAREMFSAPVPVWMTREKPVLEEGARVFAENYGQGRVTGRGDDGRWIVQFDNGAVERFQGPGLLVLYDMDMNA